ncbi:uncharacterized protein J3D65DRAFT_382487 [Phyllosticta citribraziliensis]|uniref:Uncharacterized protein n=1 Tax=Phyllosticta citribraziliensis TaxID=989973 RepID=A0ABR1LUJ0_9PEZI
MRPSTLREAFSLPPMVLWSSSSLSATIQTLSLTSTHIRSNILLDTLLLTTREPISRARVHVRARCPPIDVASMLAIFSSAGSAVSSSCRELADHPKLDGVPGCLVERPQKVIPRPPELASNGNRAIHLQHFVAMSQVRLILCLAACTWCHIVNLPCYSGLPETKGAKNKECG